MEETVRRIYDGWSRGDFNARVDLWHPDALLVLKPEFPDSGTYEGLEQIAAYMRQFLEPWELLTIGPQEFITGENVVVAGVVQRGAGRQSGLETEFRYFQVWTLRDDRVARLENVRERGDALEAAGLQ